MDIVDEIKVHAVVALCEELRGVAVDDPRYQEIVQRVDRHWRALSPAEQDEVDRLFGARLRSP
jgi:hypothetical protein